MNDDFESLAASIRRVFPCSGFEPVTEAELAAIRRTYPDVPDHYLEFLRRIGWGSLSGSNFMIYSGPCEPGEIYDEATAAELPGILLIGDDFSGWALAFDTRAGWRLVGVDNGVLEAAPIEQRTLAEFIAQRVADCQDVG